MVRLVRTALLDLLLPFLAVCMTLGFVELWIRAPTNRFWVGVAEGLVAMELGMLALPPLLLAYLGIPRLRRMEPADVRRLSAAVATAFTIAIPLTFVIGGSKGVIIAPIFAIAVLLGLLRAAPALPRMVYLALFLLLAVAPLGWIQFGGAKAFIHEKPRVVPVRALPENAPNILLISIDTLRADRLGAERDGRRLMPYLEELAADADGVSLPCVADSNQTGPSHASMLSGCCILHHKCTMNASKVGDDVPWLAAAFADAGWRTGAVISNPVISGMTGFDRDWEYFDDTIVSTERLRRAYIQQRNKSFRRRAVFALPTLGFLLAPTDFVLGGNRSWYRQQSGEVVTDHGIEMLDRLEDPDAPWFQFIHYMDPHAPYEAGPSHLGIFTDERDQELLDWKVQSDVHELLAEVPEIAKTDPAYAAELVDAMWKAYDEEVVYVDECIRDLVDRIKARGDDRPLWIVVTSDHGEHFLEHGLMTHGNSLYEELIAVPLVIHGPGLADRDDLPDTLEQVGRFLYRAALGDEQPWVDSPSCIEDGVRVHGWHTRVCVREGSWKLIFHPDDATGEIVIDGLYDLSRDPLEENDLSAEEGERMRHLATVLAELQKRMPETTGGETLRDDATLNAILNSIGYAEDTDQ